MHSILNMYNFLPLLLLVLQTFSFLMGTFVVLRYFKMLQVPYAGIEYRKVIVAAAILISVMAISLSDAEAILQSVKTFQNYGDGFYRNLFIKFSQFLLVIVLSLCLFGLLIFSSIKIIPGFKRSLAAEEDLPGAILQAIVILVFAAVLYICTKDVITSLTPKFINFS